MPHAPCLRCGQLVLATRADVVGRGYHCDLCSAITAHDAQRRVVVRAIGSTVVTMAGSVGLAIAGHPAAATTLAVGLAMTVALWAASLPRRRSRAARAC